MRTITLIATLALTTSACQTYPPQQHAGIGYYQLTFDDNGNFKSVTMVNGKEATGATMELTNKDGATLRIEVEDLDAFGGQALRSQIVQSLIENNIDPEPSLVQVILSLIYKIQR